MLYEIYCDKFISNGSPRGPIRFNPGLNVVKGHDSGTNSIGKSTFLLAVDFAFGGDSYAKDTALIAKVGHHTLKFCFLSGEEKFYFSRNTQTLTKVNICDSDYSVIETVTKEAFQDKLFEIYKIDLPKVSFRSIVGCYFRVYGKENSDEKRPLASYRGEPEKDSLITLLKLFNRYTPIEECYMKLQESEKHKKAITEADKYSLVKMINKSEYKDNLREMEKLQAELETLANYGCPDMIYLEPEQAEQAAEYKVRYETLTRRKKQLWARYYTLKDNLEKTRPATAQDFDMLLRFFPDSNIRQISEIEHFHAKLNDILNDEFKSSMREILKEINDISGEISKLEMLIKEFDLPKHISGATLKSYAKTQNRIDELTKQNELYDEKEKLDSDINSLKKEYEQSFADVCKGIYNDINTEIEKLNDYIYGNDTVPPKLSMIKSNSYEFGTDVDHGTGTNYKNLILLDLALLKLTALPSFAHDTILFHHIARDPMSKILELYSKSAKQIFIAIDETTKYPASAQHLINDNTVVTLSGNGNELFGSSWVKKSKIETANQE